MHIRGRLVLLVSAVLIPASFAATLAVWFVYAEQQHAQEKSLKEAARALALLVDNELQSSESMLHGLAQSPVLARGDLAGFYEHIKRLAPTPETAIVLTDAAGQQILNTRLPLKANAPVPGIDAVRQPRQKAGPARTIVTDLFFAATGKTYSFAIQVPVPANDGGPPRYFLGRGMSASYLSDFLASQRLPANWLASVVDRQGVIVARSADAAKFVGKRSSGPIAEKILSGVRHGTNDGYTLDGKHVIAFFDHVPISEWTAVLSVPALELRQAALYAALLLSVLMSAILVGALLIARRYARMTVEPILQLQEDARRLGEGEVLSPLRSGLVEVDAVSTALVAASTQVQHARENLEQRVAEAVEAAGRAQRALLQAQKLEALGRLTGGIAHDFNNLLQTLTTSLQIMQMERDPEKLRARIPMCQRAVARAAALVLQMRTFGRVQDAQLSTLPVDEAIEAVLPMLHSAVPGTVQFEPVVIGPLWPATFDPVQCELALLNLVINARDATPGGGKIRLLACNESIASARDGLAAGDYVCITVEDTGAGMPPEVRERALDPFFTTKSVDKGTGLGLPQAYGFATQSGGTLLLDSTQGQGTRVTIYLPRASAADDRGHPQEAEAFVLPLGTGTVLFVEDDELVRESVSPLLAQAGFSVVVARNGDEAFDMLLSGTRPDVVFSDIKMPGRNGAELAREIRSRFPELPVVLATGYSTEALDLDVRLLVKPYSTSEAIHALMDAMAGHVTVPARGDHATSGPVNE